MLKLFRIDPLQFSMQCQFSLRKKRRKKKRLRIDIKCNMYIRCTYVSASLFSAKSTSASAICSTRMLHSIVTFYHKRSHTNQSSNPKKNLELHSGTAHLHRFGLVRGAWVPGTSIAWTSEIYAHCTVYLYMKARPLSLHNGRTAGDHAIECNCI